MSRPEENRLIVAAVNWKPPPPPKCPNPYDPNKRSEPHEWRRG